MLAGCVALGVDPALPDYPDRLVRAGGFELAWYANAASKKGDTLHIYLGGDGQPLDSTGQHPSVDPTSNYALALKLAAIDPYESLFVARPCHYRVIEPNCEPSLWTSARYGAVVVDALCEAVAELAEGRAVSLMGYSGGGALAILLSHCLPTVVNVVTVNGNLATDVWANQRGFAPLSASFDPIIKGLPERVQGRLFLVGEEDAVVPAGISSHFAAEHGGDVIGFRGYGHRCCWLSAWPQILDQLQDRLPIW